MAIITLYRACVVPDPPPPPPPPPVSYPVFGYFSIDDLNICGDPLSNENTYYMDTENVQVSTELFYDEEMTLPVTGFNYFVISATGQQWALNESIVLDTTGDNCPI